MGKAELFKLPLMDVLLRNIGAFPINRSEKDPGAMRHAAKVLNHGLPLGIFSEGTHSKGRGLAVAKTGTAQLAIEANCPILPTTVTGSNQFFNGSRAGCASRSKCFRCYCLSREKIRLP
jgi:1-acyl-sn-glycerol-3-phosphate acyltransferase